MSFKSDVDTSLGKYQTAYTKIGNAIGYHSLARMQFDAGGYNAALDYIIQSVGEIVAYMSPAITYTSGGATKYYLINALMQLSAYSDEPAYELTMDSLLTTMLSADPSQVLYFVGLVDAYKQSVWNKPFNEEFYAALARGFTEWE